MFDYTSGAKREHYSGGPRNITNRANRVMEGMASDAAISQFAFRLSQMQGLPGELRQQAWDLYRSLLQQANRNLARLINSHGYPRGYRNSESRGCRRGEMDWRFGGRQPDSIWVHAQPRCQEAQGAHRCRRNRGVRLCGERIFPVSRRMRRGTRWLQLPEERET